MEIADLQTSLSDSGAITIGGKEPVSVDQCYSYGGFLGDRDKSRKNILWCLGGDRQAVNDFIAVEKFDSRPLWRAMAEGIADGVKEFNPPGEPSRGANDWVLVLDDPSKRYGAPGVPMKQPGEPTVIQSHNIDKEKSSIRHKVAVCRDQPLVAITATPGVVYEADIIDCRGSIVFS